MASTRVPAHETTHAGVRNDLVLVLGFVLLIFLVLVLVLLVLVLVLNFFCNNVAFTRNLRQIPFHFCPSNRSCTSHEKANNRRCQ